MKMDYEEYREKRRKASRECNRYRREIAKQSGLCAICCRNKPKPGRATCEECLARIKASNARRKA